MSAQRGATSAVRAERGPVPTRFSAATANRYRPAGSLRTRWCWAASTRTVLTRRTPRPAGFAFQTSTSYVVTGAPPLASGGSQASLMVRGLPDLPGLTARTSGAAGAANVVGVGVGVSVAVGVGVGVTTTVGVGDGPGEGVGEGLGVPVSEQPVVASV